MNLDNKVFTIENKKYLVIETVVFDNKNYVFLVNRENELDSMFREILNEDGNMIVKNIDPAIFNNKIYPMFLEKFQEY